LGYVKFHVSKRAQGRVQRSEVRVFRVMRSVAEIKARAGRGFVWIDLLCISMIQGKSIDRKRISLSIYNATDMIYKTIAARNIH